MSKLCGRYGVSHMTFLVWAGGASHSYPYYCTTYPEAWVTTYLEPGYFDVDPVLDIIRWGFLPVDWSFSSSGQIRPHPWHRFLWFDHSHPWAKWRTQPFSVTLAPSQTAMDTLRTSFIHEM